MRVGVGAPATFSPPRGVPAAGAELAGAAAAGAAPASEAANRSADGKRRGSMLLDNPLTGAMHMSSDISLGPTKSTKVHGGAGGVLVPSDAANSFEYSGYLYKRVGADNRPPDSWMGAVRKKARSVSAGAIAPSWQSRFFYMRGTELSYWH